MPRRPARATRAHAAALLLPAPAHPRRAMSANSNAGRLAQAQAMEWRKVPHQLQEELGYAHTLRGRLRQEDSSAFATAARRLDHATGEAHMRSVQLDVISLFNEIPARVGADAEHAEPGPGPARRADAEARRETAAAGGHHLQELGARQDGPAGPSTGARP